MIAYMKSVYRYLKYLVTREKQKYPYKIFFQQTKELNLRIPSGIYDLEKMYINSNGCGKKGDWFHPPDTIIGVDIQTACHLHDISWSLAKDKNELLKGNRDFSYNLITICDFYSDSIVLKYLRRGIVNIYIKAVNTIGLNRALKERGI